MINVICLKHGNKYGSDYVNKLYNMVQRHLTLPHKFICFTDDPSGIVADIEIRQLPNLPHISGWWWKPYLFKLGHFFADDINLFFDLDMVIVSNIDQLITYKPDEFVGLRDVSRIFKTIPPKLGSAVMRWSGDKYSNIWTDLYENFQISTRFRGDQDWIWHLHKENIKFFPDECIRSYKGEVRSKHELIRTPDRRYVFRDIQNPTLPPDTMVLAFHGTPDPHEVSDQIILDNWR
ncbi:MAG: hypothetical protein ABFD07_06965 [Methanobacterium sp.]